jgi:ankyrin repeat protein
MELRFSDQFLSMQTQNADTGLDPIVVYSPETHGSMESFLSGSNKANFERFRKEFEDEIDHVAQFAQEHVKATANKSATPGLSSGASKQITTNLAKFKKNLFGANDYYGKHKVLVYSAGKTTFFTFGELLRDDGLPLEKRLNTLKGLAKRITTTRSAVAAVLQKAVDELEFPKLVYSAEQHKDMARFLKHGNFKAFREEFDEEIDRIVKFAEKYARKEGDPDDALRLSLEAIEKIRHDLKMFKDYVFHPTHFSSEDKELIYSEGKKMFFAYGRLLHSEKTPLQARLESLPRVAEKMAVCSGGMMTELQDETDNLMAFIQGYEGKARNLIQTLARQKIVEFVRARHKPTWATEVHYVNRYFNHFASRIGCAARDHDHYADPLFRITDELLTECEDIVRREVQPSRLALRAAEQYLDIMTGAVSHLASPGETIPLDKIAQVRDILEGMQKSQEGVYGKIDPNNVLVSFDAENYQLASKPTLIAVELLRHMEECWLLTGSEESVLASATPEDEDMVELDLMGWDGRLFWVREWTGAKNSERLLLRVKNLQHFSPDEVAGSPVRTGRQAVEDFLRDIAGEAIAGARMPEAAAIPNAWLRHAPLAQMLETLRVADQEQWIALLQRALVLGSNIEERKNEQGKTPLLVAAERGLLDAVAALLEVGADPQVKDGAGKSVLALAIQNGRDDQTVEQWTAICQQLIDKGVNIEERDERDQTLLLTAAGRGLLNAITVLLKAGAAPRVKNGDSGNVLWLALKNVRNDQTVEQWTALIQLLMEKGVDIDAKSEADHTPLMVAASLGRSNGFIALADAGANLSVNALIVALKGGHDDIAATFIARACGEGPLTNEKVSLLNPPARPGGGVHDYALMNNCPKTFEAHSNFLFEAVQQNLLSLDDYNNTVENSANALVEALGRGHVEVVRSYAQFLVRGGEPSLITEGVIAQLACQGVLARQSALGSRNARAIEAANELLEKFIEKGWLTLEEAFPELSCRDHKELRETFRKKGWPKPSQEFAALVSRNRDARQGALARGLVEVLEADYKLLEKAMENRRLPQRTYKQIFLRSIQGRPAAVASGCAAALEVDNRFHLRAAQEDLLDKAKLKKLLAASNAQGLKIQPDSPQEAALREHGKAVLDAYKQGWLDQKDVKELEPKSGWLEKNLPQEWREAMEQEPAHESKQKKTITKNPMLIKGVRNIFGFTRKPKAQGETPAENIQGQDNRRATSPEQLIAPPVLLLPKQGEITAAMKRIHMLPFLFEARGRRETITLNNDCGLHVLFRLDRRLLQSWSDETKRVDALMQLQKDLRTALQQQADEGDIPGNRVGYDLTDAGITNSLLAKLFKIRGIDDNPFTAARYGLPDAPGSFDEFDDDVRRQLETGYAEGTSFALMVGDQPGNQVNIGGYVVGQGHFVTLIPARQPADSLDQPAPAEPDRQLWILSDSLHPGGEILVTTQQIKKALPYKSEDLNRSYDLISARNATVRHTHFESLIPDLRDANLSADDQKTRMSSIAETSSITDTREQLLNRWLQENDGHRLLAPEAELDKVEKSLQLSPFKAQSASPWGEWSAQLDRQKDYFLTQRFFNQNLDRIAAINEAINDKRPFSDVSEPAALADLWRNWRMHPSATLPEWPKNDLTSLAAILEKRLDESLAQREELRQDFVNKIPSRKKEAGAAPSQETLRQWLTNEANYASQIPFMGSMLKAQAAWLEEKIALKLAACLAAESEKAFGHGKVAPERVTQVLLDLDKGLERDMLLFNEAVRLQASLKTLGAAIVAGKGVGNVEWARAIAEFDALQSGSIPVGAAYPPLRANTYKQIAKHLLTPSAKRPERQKAPGETEITQAIHPLKELDHLKPRLSDEIRELLARKINETNKTKAQADPASIVENRVTNLTSFSGSVIHASKDYLYILVEGKKKQPAVVVATAEELGIEGLQQDSRVTYPPKRVAAKKRTQGK